MPRPRPPRTARPRKRPSGPSPIADIDLHGLAHGGEAVGRLPDGRACFVAFALPGERVRVRVVEQRKRYARAELVEVLRAAPERVAPPCPYFGPGRCGGCQLQHIAPDAQARLKADVVRDLLARIGQVSDPPVAPVVGVTSTGYRSTARFAVAPGGTLGFRKARSHDVEPVDRCLLLDEATQALRERAGNRWHGAAEVVVRTGSAGRVLSVRAPAGFEAPDSDADMAVVPAGEAGGGGAEAAAVTVEVAGFDFRVSAGSFFQSGPQGAALLLRCVLDAAAVRPGDRVLELFAGVGLFTRGLVADGASVTAVESGESAAADLAHNLAGTDTHVVNGDAAAAVADARAAGEEVHVVVLDPPRRGAGPQLTEAIAALDARTVVYVACDPAALARDTRTLLDHGYDLRRVVPVDQFPHTAAIEAVATFCRGRVGG